MSEAHKLLDNILRYGTKTKKTLSPTPSRPSGRVSPTSPRARVAAGPVLVRAHTAKRPTQMARHKYTKRPEPAIYPSPNLFRFDSILGAIESAELQKSLDAIALVCAKSKYSLADAYSAHRPPLGEIPVRPRLIKKLSVVPEVNSSSEESTPNTGWRDLDQQQTTEWVVKDAVGRQVQLSSIRGLGRFQLSQAPLVGLSKPSIERLPER